MGTVSLKTNKKNKKNPATIIDWCYNNGKSTSICIASQLAYHFQIVNQSVGTKTKTKTTRVKTTNQIPNLHWRKSTLKYLHILESSDGSVDVLAVENLSIAQDCFKCSFFVLLHTGEETGNYRKSSHFNWVLAKYFPKE